MSIDLGQFETGTEGEWMEVLHPVSGTLIRDEDGNAMRVLLVGKDSKEYRKASRALTERRLRSRSRSRKIDADTIEQEAVDILVACTKEWEGFGEAGADLECTPENVRRVYTRFAWLREQVDEFVDDRGNFMKS